MRGTSLTIIGLLLIAYAGTGAAQQAAPRRLTERLATAAHGYTAIGSVAELADGRVAVVDPKDRSVMLLTADLASFRPIGRRGDGPGEYSGNLGGVFIVGADTLLLHDAGNRRFQAFDRDGKPAGTIPLPADRAANSPGVAFSRVAGNRRYCAQRVVIPPGQAARPDSVPIVCGRFGTSVRPITSIRQATLTEEVILGPGEKMQVLVWGAAEDDWTIASNGDVAIVRNAPYRVEWHPASGDPVIGPPIPWVAVPVTRADRDELVAARQAAQGTASRGGMQIGGRGMRIAGVLPSDVPPPMTPHKPPFVLRSLVAGPGRELWIGRHQPHGALPQYDVVDGSGRVAHQVQLAGRGSRIVAVTARHVYVDREDGDGLHHLERWRRP